ncbi:GNAT family N-acetyltransferase [Halobacillus sp. HZG1]|uniref:GNAT family N-acetyltransferase n=1 Tax=Halobacillus sp. HZG1 TaxID=3111769 RepID=UPI002DBEA534|nr:GNAT family N-acetyltransferase [Halobacillus sp. HZG1]MEC3885553.1 GNAT family N-acetyltransferase [Halobacillus sp. HZG1]
MTTLRRMSEEEFLNYNDFSIVAYAKEKVAAGNWTEDEALEKARTTHAELLPDGRDTENQFLYTILSEKGENAGSLWICKQSSDKAFIYDIRISDEHQGQGHGKNAMRLAEEEARKIGVQKIGLHVFGHNTVARKLYESLSYKTTNVKMEKDIHPGNDEEKPKRTLD